MANKSTYTLKAPPADRPVRPSASKELPDDFHKLAAERADEAYQADRHNIDAAYEDLTFLGGDQWPDYAKPSARPRNGRCWSKTGCRSSCSRSPETST